MISDFLEIGYAIILQSYNFYFIYVFYKILFIDIINILFKRIGFNCQIHIFKSYFRNIIYSLLN